MWGPPHAVGEIMLFRGICQVIFLDMPKIANRLKEQWTGHLIDTSACACMYLTRHWRTEVLFYKATLGFSAVSEIVTSTIFYSVPTFPEKLISPACALRF
jgi:hypothetical protein